MIWVYTFGAVGLMAWLLTPKRRKPTGRDHVRLRHIERPRP